MALRLTTAMTHTAVGLAVLAVAGCGGSNPFSPPPPDEFAVIKTKPLQMPPGFGLPEPRPGAPSPLDIDPNREAEIALLGRPLPDRTTSSVSTSEAALLSSADASAASSEVRVQLEQDAEETGPYEPPTVLELLGISDPTAGPDPGQLRPEEEARRLQAQGIVAPSDPDAPPPAAETAENAEDDQIPLQLAPAASRPPRETDLVQ